MSDIIEIVVTESLLFRDSIQNNLVEKKDIKTIFLSSNIEGFISSCPKIDLLIIDYQHINKLKSLYHIKNIINLTNVHFRNDEIMLKLPVKLTDLLDIIYNNRIRAWIFLKLNKEWIYDEQRSIIFNSTTKVKLTEKENEVFKNLCLAPANIMYKSDLLRGVWCYDVETNSNTIETHLYRLKHKLPSNMLQICNDYYKLIIS